MKKEAFLRLTKGQAFNAEGLLLLRLAVWSEGKEVDHVTAVSGQPGRQNFRLAKDRWPGSMEPIGEAWYDLGDPDAEERINWAISRGVFRGSFGAGLGPMWVGIHPPYGNPLRIRSNDFGIHADANEDFSPGTSGCVGIQGEHAQDDFERLRKVAGWFGTYDVKRLYVDWGLGSVPKP